MCGTVAEGKAVVNGASVPPSCDCVQDKNRPDSYAPWIDTIVRTPN